MILWFRVHQLRSYITVLGAVALSGVLRRLADAPLFHIFDPSIIPGIVAAAVIVSVEPVAPSLECRQPRLRAARAILVITLGVSGATALALATPVDGDPFILWVALRSFALSLGLGLMLRSWWGRTWLAMVPLIRVVPASVLVPGSDSAWARVLWEFAEVTSLRTLGVLAVLLSGIFVWVWLGPRFGGE